MKYKTIFYILFIFFTIVATLSQFFSEKSLTWICQEDGIVEWATALFYFAATFFCLMANKRKSFKNVWLWGFTLLFLFVAGEEISWGQRIFGISTPEALSEINVQQEINIHNIKGIHGSIRFASVLFIIGVCFILPLAERYIKKIREIVRKIKMPVFPFWVMGVQLVAILLMAVPRFITHSAIFNLDEVGELYLSMGFLIFSYLQWREA